jgi:hypothetical protein
VPCVIGASNVSECSAKVKKCALRYWCAERPVKVPKHGHFLSVENIFKGPEWCAVEFNC